MRGLGILAAFLALSATDAYATTYFRVPAGTSTSSGAAAASGGAAPSTSTSSTTAGGPSSTSDGSGTSAPTASTSNDPSAATPVTPPAAPALSLVANRPFVPVLQTGQIAVASWDVVGGVPPFVVTTVPSTLPNGYDLDDTSNKFQSLELYELARTDALATQVPITINVVDSASPPNAASVTLPGFAIVQPPPVVQAVPPLTLSLSTPFPSPAPANNFAAASYVVAGGTPPYKATSSALPSDVELVDRSNSFGEVFLYDLWQPAGDYGTMTVTVTDSSTPAMTATATTDDFLVVDQQASQ